MADITEEHDLDSPEDAEKFLAEWRVLVDKSNKMLKRKGGSLDKRILKLLVLYTNRYLSLVEVQNERLANQNPDVN